jgi:hypothetical protein
MVEIRDRVVVESEKVGDPPRTGVVTAVTGQLINIRWDKGGESSLIPSAGSLRVEGREPKSRSK